MATDPVCGMRVNVATAQHVAHHNGADVYFCSAQCRDKFEVDPDAYTDAPPVDAQAAYWDQWNAESRERSQETVASDQADRVLAWMRTKQRNDLDIIDVGCGAGWLSERLVEFGQVTATDMTPGVLARAAKRVPDVNFVTGDFMKLDFGREAFDVVVSLEVLSHVPDQPAFIAKLADLLRPGGTLILSTQNRPQLMRNNVPPPNPGQIRKWVDRHELAKLLSARFDVEELICITPQCNRGILRVINYSKLHALLRGTGLGAVSRVIKSTQEKAWLGWTLMALAQKRG